MEYVILCKFRKERILSFDLVTVFHRNCQRPNYKLVFSKINLNLYLPHCGMTKTFSEGDPSGASVNFRVGNTSTTDLRKMPLKPLNMPSNTLAILEISNLSRLMITLLDKLGWLVRVDQ